MNRVFRLSCCIAIAAALWAALSVHQSAKAQAGEPTAIIDAVLKDLSTRLGQTLTRGNVDTYSWDQEDFPNSSLGCASAGGVSAQVITRGYKVLVTVKGVVYDYRASNDGKTIIQCAAGAAPQTVIAPATTPGTPVVAPTLAPGRPQLPYIAPIAYIGRDGNVYVTDPSGRAPTALTADGGNHQYGQLRWSPDGTKLAFTDFMVNTISVVRSGQAPAIVTGGILAEYPPGWSADSTEVFYLVPTQQQSGNGQIVQVQAAPAAGGQPRVAGQILMSGGGCGGGGFDPALSAYMRDVGYEGNRQTLAQTSQGYLFTLNCTGVGLGLAAAQSTVWQRTNLSGAALSPDRRQLIALRRTSGDPAALGGVLERVDLATGKGTDIATQPNIAQIAWSVDSSQILYSTVTPGAKLIANPTTVNTSDLMLNGFLQAAQTYTVTLWRMPAAGGASTQVFSREGYAIGLIVPLADNATVLVSFIDSLNGMVSAFKANKSVAEISAAAPHAELLTASFTGQSAVHFADGGQLNAAFIGTFSAVPAVPSGIVPVNNTTPDSQGVAPPALIIGGKAIVTATGGSLNMRQSPSVSAPVKRLLMPNTIVIVITGPQLADSLRWWQVRAPDGTIGWIADQITSSVGIVNTVAPQ